MVQMISPYSFNINDYKNSVLLNRQQKYTKTTTQFPNAGRNYCVFNQEKVDYYMNLKEGALPYLSNILKKSDDEMEVTEALYILNLMLDKNVKGIDKLYPILSRFNGTNSANIQTFLAGIYRKTQVPDAFGPLVSMLIKNSLKPQAKNQYFDPNEEIGGAILSYISDRWR